MNASFGSNGIVGIVIVVIILILVLVGIWYLTPSNCNTFGGNYASNVIVQGNAGQTSNGSPYRVDLACGKACKSKGKGTFGWAEAGQNALKYNIQYDGLTGPVTAASIRYANNNKVAYPLALNGGNVQFSEKDAVLMKNGGMYVAVQTQRYPEGEVVGSFQC